jgi:hypothetical protein
MAIELTPYGQLANGNYGILLDNTTGKPLASAIEVLVSLPALGDPSNFDGRTVFDTTAQVLYIYKSGTPEWFPLEGIPVIVNAVSGNPPLVPVPTTGLLFFDTDTEVMFVYDGTAWFPIGGRFASRFIEQSTVSSGVAGPGGDTFALGSTPVFSEFVEVFLDGVRQVPSDDYIVIGSSIAFPAPVAALVIVYTRTVESTILETPALLQNAQCIRAIYENQAAGITDFDVGAAGIDPACTMVFLNGTFLHGGNVDYNVSTANTTINAITKVAATTARATTAFVHGAAVGDAVTISGCTEPEFNGNFLISGVTAPTEFEYVVVITAPAACTQAVVSVPVSYSPPFVNDKIILNIGTTLGDDISIMTFQRIIVAPSSGESNTASNLGVGTGIFSTKAGVDLRFKSLSGSTGINIVDAGPDLVISADGIITFESRSGINAALYFVSVSDSYVGVRNTAAPVIIDLSSVPVGPSGSGRRLVITDESGGAGANNISISHAGALFNGIPSPLVINVDYGSVTIVHDGTNWTIAAKTF